MGYHPVTPFGRTLDAVLLSHQQRHRAQTCTQNSACPPDLSGRALAHPAALPDCQPACAISKWEILRELATARRVFDLSDRDLAVLQALLGFWPKPDLDPATDLVVHPSNRAICERLNGMANSTMRRYLSRLVEAGFLIRRDSPNGKRYARRYGAEKVAYGFDLAPLLHRHAEICAAAEAIRAQEQALKRLRETVSLMRRDLAGLALYGMDLRPELPLWDRLGDLAALCARALRRKLALTDLAAMEAQLRVALDEARAVLDPDIAPAITPLPAPESKPVDPVDAADLSSKAAGSEHHHQNSQKDSFESERATAVVQPVRNAPATKDSAAEESRAKGRACASVNPARALVGLPSEGSDKLPNVPLSLVLSACPEVQSYAEGPIRHWHDLVRAAHLLRPMMGISPSAWDDAMQAMGPEEASVVLAAMLERFGAISSPGGYLRHLSAKAQAGGFSCGPMVMALLRRERA